MIRALDVGTSLASTIARLGAGLSVGEVGPRPHEPLELYEFEGCPYCRKVREALSMLDLDAIVYPCPSGGKRFRAKVRKLGGKEQFPYLVDPNTGTKMYESDAIIDYLYKTYGAGSPPLVLRMGPLTNVTSFVATAIRPLRGRNVVASKAPKKPLELWSFEASPFCRIAREALCELEIPYRLHNVAKNSTQRAAFTKRSGKMMVPFLVDPNTGTELFESADIVSYLYDTYAR